MSFFVIVRRRLGGAKDVFLGFQAGRSTGSFKVTAGWHIDFLNAAAPFQALIMQREDAEAALADINRTAGDGQCMHTIEPVETAFK
ncbi:hypothetical protein FDI24_gp059 [Acidovorax phage ACP17]|uniref:Uncharacterized protein n=1 Tax=Acidovorax phage ACP17 TaxID=2010329 RepID=A0A223AIY2_9CAUD|nr:hypothetical protein FDI24_gp059 [Acidovorax phage ACP17]ASS33925.1 hypothetical protein [Acidovorax phage ACP17]